MSVVEFTELSLPRPMVPPRSPLAKVLPRPPLARRTLSLLRLAIVSTTFSPSVARTLRPPLSTRMMLPSLSLSRFRIWRTVTTSSATPRSARPVSTHSLPPLLARAARSLLSSSSFRLVDSILTILVSNSLTPTKLGAAVPVSP